ncbi:hypothetical protein AB4Y67_10230 [Arthrobacter sp. YAF17]|uniref:hypothetical protein n=1 Tax=Arthrobacter sp. YAF17 TaxID=3233077 RepID=UPI003F934A51
MLLHDLGRGLLRRWYFVVIGVLLTACGALLLASVVPPTHRATARVVLIPPPSLVSADGNPYLFLGGLEQALGVLTVKLGSEATSEQILEAYPDGSYTAVKDTLSPGPIMLITAESESSDGTLQVLDAVLRVVPENLENMQDQLNIPDASRITALTIVREDATTKVLQSQLRAVLGGVALGLSMTVLLTGLLDRLLTSRKKKAGRRHASGPGVELHEEPSPAADDQVRMSRRGTKRSRRPAPEPEAMEPPAAEDGSDGPERDKDELPTMVTNQ